MSRKKIVYDRSEAKDVWPFDERDLVQDTRTGNNLFARLLSIHTESSSRYYGKKCMASTEEIVEYIDKNEDMQAIQWFPPPPRNLKYTGEAYFNQLDDKWDVINRASGERGDYEYTPPVDFEKLIGVGNGYTFVTSSGPVWKPIEFQLGVSDPDYVEPKPLPRTCEGRAELVQKLNSRVLRNCRYPDQHRDLWKSSFERFFAAMQLANDRFNLLCDPSCGIEVDDSEFKRAHKEVLRLDHFEDSPIVENSWDSFLLDDSESSKIVKRKVSKAFIEAHNRNVLAMHKLITGPEEDCKPMYPAVSCRIYRSRLIADEKLHKAFQLRILMDEKILTLRIKAKLAKLNVHEILEPYEEPENNWKKILSQNHKRTTLAQKLKKRDGIFNDPAEQVPDARETATVRKWAIGFGEVGIADNIYNLPVAGKPTPMTAGMKTDGSVDSANAAVSAHEALEWAFYRATGQEFSRNTLPKSEKVSMVIDFESMQITLTCVRDGVKMSDTIPLDPLFVKNEDHDRLLELKLIPIDEYEELEEQKKNKMALHWAIKANYIDTALGVLPKIVDINAPDDDGYTPLHLAVKGKHADFVKELLVVEGIRTDAIDRRDGNTPLHIAIEMQLIDIAIILIEAGCDLTIKNKVNKTPLECFQSAEKQHDFYINGPITEKTLKTNYMAFWFHVIQLENVKDLEVKVLEFVQRNLELGYAKDKDGRIAVEMATPANRAVINSEYLWFGRYRVTESRPEHTSATCFVFKAADEENTDDAGNPMPVALKLMRMKAHFLREISARSCDFNSDYVVDIVNRYPQTDEELEKLGDEEGADVGGQLSLTKKQAEKFFCIVMPLANRNMFVALKQERFAGRNLDEIRHVFSQLLECIEHMHGKGVLHGDIKTLNIVRTEDVRWKMIDMDATCVIGKDPVGFKSSSAYVPPEAVYINEDRTKAVVRSQFIKECEPLVAHPSFDIWSLGCILYQLCNREVKQLFQAGQDDNLSCDINDDETLFTLGDWTPAVKEKKLNRCMDPMVKNLLSQMLNKDPMKRPPISRILAHPFVSQKQVARLIGEEAEFDVFISYRVASDAKHAELLYNLLTSKGLKVWWDKLCLEPGVEWKEGFCAGLINSRTFVCILSPDAINHPEVDRQSFARLTPASACDNVLLEHRLALELRSMGLIEKVYPVMIGKCYGTNVENFFATGGMPKCPNISVDAVEKDLRVHLDSQALGSPLDDSVTVATVLQAITSCQGAVIEGELNVAFEAASDTIVGMLEDLKAEDRARTVKSVVNAGHPTHANVNADALDTLKKELEVAKSEIKELKARLEATTISTSTTVATDSHSAPASVTSPDTSSLACPSPRRKTSVENLQRSILDGKDLEIQTLSKELKDIKASLEKAVEQNQQLSMKVNLMNLKHKKQNQHNQRSDSKENE